MVVWFALAVIWMGVLVPSVLAQETESDLASLSRELGSEEGQTRQAAIERLSSLGPEALPAIEQRLLRLRRGRPTASEVSDALHAIRRGAGSRRADDLLDIAPGVTVVLETNRSPAMLRVAEPLLLLRSLERLATTDALRMVPDILGLDGEPWRIEGRRVTLRMGDRIAAAAIYARSMDGNPEGRAWARWTTDRLDLDNPGALAQRLSGADLADVLLAYSATHTLTAIPVVASFIDADQRHLRETARVALRGYRQNGVWVARETYETRLGQEPELSWGWERTLDELFSRLDAARSAHLHAALADATHALDRGEPDAALGSLDRALARSPELASLEAARLYARMATYEEDTGRREALLRRALTLAADAPEAREWEGRVAFEQARRGLAAGVLDAEAFARSTEAAPGCDLCTAMTTSLAAQARASEHERTLPYAASAALFLLLAVLLATSKRGRRGTSLEPPPSPADRLDPTLS
ncbi:MAG: tetratricopeptide repeat protein [Deltaproteobacteria bacterium]